ncbi:MAG: DUF2249 domain-containing protein [Nakamurella sp.]
MNVELDVHLLSPADKLEELNRQFLDLTRGQTLVLIDDEDPSVLQAQFDVDHVGSYSWTIPERTSPLHLIHITRLTAADVPRVLGNAQLVAAEAQTSPAGVVWKLQPRQRQLDANIVRLPAHGAIDSHLGGDLDVLLVVLDGAGTLTTETGDIELTAGSLAWLPRRSLRAFSADAAGLTYFTVHQRRQGLTIGRRPTTA